MILRPGEKIHVIHQPKFDGDTRRHFAGTVEVCEGVMVRVHGYLFAMDKKSNEFVKREPPRTRIISLVSDSIIINVLPESVQLDKLTYKNRTLGEMFIADGGEWHLDITHL